ncbi:MAG: hypothetical protein ABIT38_17795 [Gemmatimonadaceae bacterium]
MSATQPIARRSDEAAEDPRSARPQSPEIAELERALAADWGNDRMPLPAPEAPKASAERPRAPAVTTRHAEPLRVKDLPAPLSESFAANSQLVTPSLPSPANEVSAKESPSKKGRIATVRTFRWMAILGAIGFVAGGGIAGAFAWRMGYDLRLSSAIAFLAGTATASAAMVIPPLARALGWTMLAGAVGGVGAGALWLLTRIAPALIDRILH